MTTPNQDLQQPQKLSSVESGRRRRFLGAGVSAAPVMLTLVSQPALGGTCFSPSQSLSNNTSVSRPKPQCVGAESPGNYMAQTTNWPMSQVKPTDKFHNVFLAGANVDFGNRTFQQVLELSGNKDKFKTAFHVIGAYLNILRGFIPQEVLDVKALKEIWSQYAADGTYQPIPGSLTEWNGEKIVEYLKNNDIVK